ncbi:YbaB/EbfC family nucleoid-associated protein [Actinosynnema sp. NPDC050436]|uniref:YbaB/EbfC family nucleoid-associated protein n=1 Tax=Actinosynnema sp. NPDC050436 TaxID=3155659 RepID=UPI0033C38BC7
MSAQEERVAAADRLADLLSRVTATAEHPSGLVTVTASAAGALRSVRLHPAALGHGPDAVGGLVAETARLATDAAVQTGYNELAKTLGDSMAMAVEDFAGPPPLHRQADPAEAWGATASDRPAHLRDTSRQPGAGDPRTAPGRPGHGQPAHRRDERDPGQPPGSRDASGSGQASGTGPPAPAAPPWSSGRPRGPRPARPRPAAPVEDDDDDFFADPFRGQRR